jgi:hypothetical protein
MVMEIMFEGVFSDIVKTSPKSEDVAEKTEVKPSVFLYNPPSKPKNIDPRFDDLTADTIHWQQMLAVAQDNTTVPDLYAALKYLRARGTIVRRLPNGRLYPGPFIDKTGCNGWLNEGEYEAEKIRIFGLATAPNEVGKALIELLNKFKKAA